MRRNGSVQRRQWPGGAVTYRVRWTDAAGRRQSASCDSRQAGEMFLRARLAEMDRGLDGSYAGRRVTLADWWRQYSAGRQIGPLTAAREATVWSKWVEPELGGVALTDIRPSLLAAWVAFQVKAGLAPRTVARHVQVLSPALSAAVADGLIAVNPALGLRLPRAQRNEQRFLSVDEVKAMEDAMPAQWKLLVPFGVITGLRIGELLSTSCTGPSQYGVRCLLPQAGPGRRSPVPVRGEWSRR